MGTTNRIKGNCAYCRGERNLKILRSVHIEWGDEDVEGAHDYQIVQCEGCEAVSFRVVSTCTEDFDENGYIHMIKRYPEMESRQARDDITLPDGFDGSYDLDHLYDEVISSLNHGNNMLCAAGLRALIEGMCLGLGVKKGPVKQEDGTTVNKTNLQGKIEGLVVAGHATRIEADALHEQRFTGNDAVHVLYKPSDAEILNALNIVEHLMFQIYEIEKVTAMLSKKRKAKQTKTTTPPPLPELD
jgi:hypothetical protein